MSFSFPHLLLFKQINMTPPKSSGFCPMCKRTYVAMSHHLKRSHRVTNLQEREILLKQASGRVNIRNIPCPVSGCTYNKGRCDKHLRTGHPELTDTLRTTYINVAKEKKTKQLLMELRATNPVPPMASALDLGSEDEEGADVGSPHAAPSFDCGGCRSLALENEVLKNDLAKLRSRYKALHKRLRRVLKGKGLSASDIAGVSEEEEEEAGPSSSALRLISQAVSAASSKPAGSQSSSQAMSQATTKAAGSQSSSQ
ncbi:hypothetical protein GOODEAATRI_028577, partial [Goodea atripinnis]